MSDWRAAALDRVRALIRDADPEASEEVKWRKPSNPAGVPVWERDGIICTGETYKDKVKLTFARGASLADPAGLFNASLDAGTRRAIDIREGEAILASLLARPPRVQRHVIANVVVDVEDEDHARAFSVIVLYQGDPLPEGLPAMSASSPLVGTFADQLVRTRDGWRFAERLGALDFAP